MWFGVTLIAIGAVAIVVTAILAWRLARDPERPTPFERDLEIREKLATLNALYRAAEQRQRLDDKIKKAPMRDRPALYRERAKLVRRIRSMEKRLGIERDE